MGGVSCLIVRLPDGTPGTIAVVATIAARALGSAAEEPVGALLSAEGVRRLRALLGGQVADGSGT